jgi:hypothetical protein
LRDCGGGVVVECERAAEWVFGGGVVVRGGGAGVRGGAKGGAAGVLRLVVGRDGARREGARRCKQLRGRWVSCG